MRSCFYSYHKPPDSLSVQYAYWHVQKCSTRIHALYLRFCGVRMRSRHYQKMKCHHFFSNQCTTASFLVSRLAFVVFSTAKQGRVPFLLLRNAKLGVALRSKLRSPQPKKETIFAAIFSQYGVVTFPGLPTVQLLVGYCPILDGGEAAWEWSQGALECTLASFPGSPTSECKYPGRTWYLFSREHDMIERGQDFQNRKGNIYMLVHHTLFTS